MNYFAVNVKNISKSFGSIEAISRGFSCGFHRSTSTVLLGRNGAGKTTLLNLITNTLLFDSGSIYINGCDNRAPNSRIGLRYLPDEVHIPSGISSLDLLSEYQRNRSDVLKSEFYEMVSRFDGLDRLEKELSDRSTGQKQLILLAITLSGSPSLVILDEPMEGLDPIHAKIVRDRIDELAKSGCTIIQSTHRIHEAERQRGHYVIIDKGSFCKAGNISDIDNYKKVCISDIKEASQTIPNDTITIDGCVIIDEKQIPGTIPQECIHPTTLEDFYIGIISSNAY